MQSFHIGPDPSLLLSSRDFRIPQVPQHSPRPPLLAPYHDVDDDDEQSESHGSESSHSAKEPIQVGMTTETKDLYREDPRAPWEEWAPEDIGVNSKSTPASAKFALIVRREKRNGDTEEPVLALHSITVQSPLIKSRLGPVFAGYQGINTNLKKLEFRAPFREFFYRWSEFVRATPGAEDDDDVDKNHFALLFDIISSEIRPHIDQVEDLLKNEVISFDYVWALFEPGTEVYSTANGQDRLFLVNGGHYQELMGGMKVYTLLCRYIDTDGDLFGYTTISLSIADFENVKPISELNVLPSHLHPQINEIRVQLQKRGRRFEMLKGTHYKAYSGYSTLRSPSFRGSSKYFIDDGRVMIDTSSFMRYNGESPGQLGPLNGPTSSDHLNVFQDFTDPDELNEIAPPAVQVMQHTARQARRRFASTQQTSKGSKSLSEEHYVLCSPTVKGFDFQAKEWVYLYVDDVKDIVWNMDAFGQLVLPQEEYKEIIWAFVEAQLSGSDNFDDIVKGKGKGVILLLSGEPGTGKTLTAESVAEAMNKPLYSMSAGELGIEAGEVEKNLRQVLELSTRWGAVLLLDECDVFLERRTTADLHRNKLVSVFLRLLEYYQGVMFLTTNRLASFDPAFESRIHLTIHYPQLDFDSRLHVWRVFVRPGTTSSSVQESELEGLARPELNGRQIKNVVKTARLLAARDKTPLGLKHIETVLKVKRDGPTGFGKNEV
ncbi:P-loop containing nucleoside triphosphate hydrolase protein [Hypoxylon trugodes]|uniref:P-loop containing nucleoside triphosphate hydrolase protein n=1 Tax=Hypoxylon trugodes TaxID=326681 RepID=UPI002192C41F|nr:P-loop containing nucleoside triphosphate hydrolase protein [Hypoxylon trugodes]KAI1389583.1 P-loop containing nucleoside triphosphate hydrolase protein [Hypoxylon trugodes]